ncbi:MAG: pyridoxamine 5'-phosphate oxidase family protein [Candidatus Lokiarchaeota archaeon]|nr:pyridoxamine 5'-phosphate oxidase family protein [Candidatus Lokiarchaeota archaeon]
MDGSARDETIKCIVDYLQCHRILTMATATKDGDPDATALEYTNDGVAVYVSCRPGSRKVENILENPRVFYEVHDDIEITRESVKKLKAVQVAASATVLRPGMQGFDHAFSLLVAKFPVFSTMQMDSRVILKFTPRKAWFLDYKRKFFHRDEVSFES